jgi:hypothetical protein
VASTVYRVIGQIGMAANIKVESVHALLCSFRLKNLQRKFRLFVPATAAASEVVRRERSHPT